MGEQSSRKQHNATVDVTGRVSEGVQGAGIENPAKFEISLIYYSNVAI